MASHLRVLLRNPMAETPKIHKMAVGSPRSIVYVSNIKRKARNALAKTR